MYSLIALRPKLNMNTLTTNLIFLHIFIKKHLSPSVTLTPYEESQVTLGRPLSAYHRLT
jgi:hypothetical protein